MPATTTRPTCTGCLAEIVTTTSTIGGVEVAVPVGHDQRIGPGEYGAPCPGTGWPVLPAPGAPAAEWAARTQALTTEVMALPMGGEWAAPGVPSLTVSGRSFGRVPETTVLDGTAVPETVMLTGDGRTVWTSTWCRCAAAALMVDAVYFELWTAQGRASHGWACPGCRHVVQTG